MRKWLTRIGAIGLVVTIAIAFGNIEALAVALLLATFVKREDQILNRRLKVGLLLIWIGAFVMTACVTAVALGPQTPDRNKLILRLYDLNCSAPFPTYRYPRSVVWLAEGGPYSGSWNAILVCRH